MIGHDARKNSAEFAADAARVVAAHGGRALMLPSALADPARRLRSAPPRSRRGRWCAPRVTTRRWTTATRCIWPMVRKWWHRSTQQSPRHIEAARQRRRRGGAERPGHPDGSTPRSRTRTSITWSPFPTSMPHESNGPPRHDRLLRAARCRCGTHRRRVRPHRIRPGGRRRRATRPGRDLPHRCVTESRERGRAGAHS